jgi:tRNA pseudouridine13 synthase
MSSLSPIFENEEKFVGMEGYSTQTPSFGGQIKLSISDFIVREITPNGEALTTWEKSDPIVSDYQYGKDRYTVFTLIKKNMDTIYASQVIQEYLDVPAKNLSWAGIKDNTAITSQQFSVKGDFIQKLSKFSHKDIQITQLYGSPNMIELGGHWGNSFIINVRKLNLEFQSIKDQIEKWVQKMDESGFPNYYGLQRFGQFRPNSQIIGKRFFQGDYEGAVREFLFTIYPAEYSNISAFRREFAHSQDYAKAMKNCPSSLYYEKLILESLEKDPLNYLGAFLKLPVPLINLIMSSFQSYIFNKLISLRIKQGDPLSIPVPGDIISILSEPRGQPSMVFYKYGGWNDEAILKAFKYDRATIIAPIVGFKTDLGKFPYWESIVKEIMVEESFRQDQFQHKHYQLFNFEGTFRPIFIKPTKLSISPAYITNKYPEKDPFGVQLEFNLPKGTYATSLLREFSKS